ncbi:hypothetical protein ABZY09_43205 [Streptomyces sp. NPDC002928]|uniref:hypothetical protein n=1 Tax=Streptomyces sp. NPDC002928 TaxID=3154440 RepID=UPI0033BC2B9F
MCAIIGGVIAWKALAPSEKSADAAVSAEEREKKKEQDEKEIADGPPVKFTPGYPEWYAYNYAFPEPIGKLGEAANYDMEDPRWSGWFRDHEGREIGLTSRRITINALHEGTTIIQGMRVADLQCTDTAMNGTLVIPKPIGDGGDDVQRTVIGFDLSEPSPRPRVVEGYPEKGQETNVKFGGAAFTETVTLDKGDARTFEIYFVSPTRDCTFGLEVNVTSADRDEWIPVDFGDGKKEYLAGRAEKYQSLVRPTLDYSGQEVGDVKDAYTPPVTVTKRSG